MEGSREEVVRYIRLVMAEFQIPDERTSTAKLQDWAVNLAWGGSDAPASPGMMNIMRHDGRRQIDTGTYDGGAYVSRHATSVAQVNDGTAGGSARSHNDV